MLFNSEKFLELFLCFQVFIVSLLFSFPLAFCSTLRDSLSTLSFNRPNEIFQFCYFLNFQWSLKNIFLLFLLFKVVSCYQFKDIQYFSYVCNDTNNSFRRFYSSLESLSIAFLVSVFQLEDFFNCLGSLVGLSCLSRALNQIGTC